MFDDDAANRKSPEDSKLVSETVLTGEGDIKKAVEEAA